MSLNKTILIMDNDHLALAILSAGLQKILDKFEILKPVDSGSSAIKLCTSHHPPSVLLADISMTDINGLTVCKEIRQENFTTTIIMMSSFPIDRFMRPAYYSGAQGLIHKNSLQEIARAIESVSSGRPLPCSFADNKNEHFLTASQAFHLLKENQASDLSPREAEVVDLWSQGIPMSAIADQLDISRTTVRTHLLHAADKLKAPNNRALIAAWLSYKQEDFPL